MLLIARIRLDLMLALLTSTTLDTPSTKKFLSYNTRYSSDLLLHYDKANQQTEYIL